MHVHASSLLTSTSSTSNAVPTLRRPSDPKDTLTDLLYKRRGEVDVAGETWESAPPESSADCPKAIIPDPVLAETMSGGRPFITLAEAAYLELGCQGVVSFI